ncbi:hypothetical protein SBA1_1390009 [Candidatus Sulfotelmatobacter kueseliae]|uniref:Uncharacterized protein n=1 Tax=Candidatus Sulfotelmatobacter kueseliae TaxID=2042962 RepID=A0A2U3K611_9BACT|nr:hypothetical protein SBA1_1390009 [Candidatus Sulfotelmatobacter kueseliae]
MEMCWTAASASGPCSRMSPMWLTSKMPTPVRTALCSAIMPPADGYSTGMSQPLNSTTLAPIWRWTEFSAVLRITGVVVSAADNFSSIKSSGLGCWDGETHYPNMQTAKAATEGQAAKSDTRSNFLDMSSSGLPHSVQWLTARTTFSFPSVP